MEGRGGREANRGVVGPAQTPSFPQLPPLFPPCLAPCRGAVVEDRAAARSKAERLVDAKGPRRGVQ